MQTIRVAFFMRGSTTKQSSQGKLKKLQKSGKKTAKEINVEDDLPLQRETMMNYLNTQPEQNKGVIWEFTGIEYTENGVSGFHKHISKRKGMKAALEGAKNDHFDLLLTFKLDRFGRRSSETLDAVSKIARIKRIWVATKGQEFLNNNSDQELLNFFEFYLAKRASEDTKIRVENAMKLIHEQGLWTGGNPPFGFENDPEISNMLKQIPEEADIVKTIYDLYVNHGFGYLKISAYLNENKKPSKTGGKWSSHTISKILSNTVYKGFLSYGKTKVVEGEFGAYQKTLKEGGHVSDRYWKEYDIVGAELWEKAQTIKNSRVKENMFGGKTPSKKATGKGLLIGVLKCECGGHMTYSTASDWADNKRTHKKEPYGVYRCMTRLKKGVDACGAKKATYKVDQLEKEVVEAIFKYTNQLIDSKEIEAIQEKTASATIQIKDQIEEVKADIKRYTEAQEKAEKLQMKILLGELEGKPDLYIKMFDTATEKLKELKKKYEELEALKNTDDLNEIDMIKLEEFILSWKNIFEFGTQEQKRNLIQAFVNEIKVTKEKTIIKFGFEIPKFVEVITAMKETAASVENAEKVSGEAYLYFMESGSSNCEQNTGMETNLYSMDSGNYNRKQITSMIKKLNKIFSHQLTQEMII